MNRRRRFILIVACLALLTCATTATLVHLSKPFPVVAYEQITLGMTLDEVNAIIGQPYPIPSDDTARGMQCEVTGQTVPLREAGGDFNLPPGGRAELWVMYDYCILVVFDQDGGAIHTELSEKGTKRTLFQRLRAWLGL